MRHTGFVVPPRKKADIYTIAGFVRERFAPLIKDGKLPIHVVYELLPTVLPEFVLEVCEAEEMGDDHGLTYPDKMLIKLRRDIYDGMSRGLGRDRFTAAHELGHLFLHRNIGFARKMSDPDTKIYRNSEWQADSFASALLIDKGELAKCRSVTEVAQRFGVSLPAASARFKL